MIRLVRITGFLLVGAGAVLLLTWLIEPLRMFWPWFRSFPLPVQLGTGAAALGLIIILASLIHERLEDREADRDLLDEFVDRPGAPQPQKETGATDS